MPVTCIIDFDNNPHGIYFAGQVVTGKITLQTTEPKKVNALILKISGFAHTNWSERVAIKFSVWYTGHEDYVEAITYLMGSAEKTLIDIQPGIYTFNFACQIPITCPSSFEGINGHIRYTVAVSFERSWKFDDTFARNFTVAKVEDVDYDDSILNDNVAAEIYHTFGCGPCKSGPLKINVSTPECRYLPGDIIPIDVLVNNESNVCIEEMKYSLVMNIRHFSQSPYLHAKDQKIKVMKFKREGVQRQSSKLMQYSLLIPATPPTCVNLCGIIKITYELQVEAKVKGCRTNPFMCIPIIIGIIPSSAVMQQDPRCIVSNANIGSNTVVPKSESQLVAAIEDLRNINPRPIENNADAVQIPSGCSSISPPNLDEGVPTTCLSQITESKGISAAMPENSANLTTAIFKEAKHLNLGKYRKNAFSPRYPVCTQRFVLIDTDNNVTLLEMK